jgi:ABC-type transport system involved in Fe-S cluster assembly fused permease/ATPase subunit
MHDTHSNLPTVKGKDLLTLRAMLPYLWRHRWRTGLALLSLLTAKFAVVGVPLLLKHIVDALDASHNRVLVLPLSLLLGYGALRLSGSLFNELRDTLFAKVRHGIVREVAGQVLAHLHALSLRFHLERKTGGLTRDIERGTTSMSNLLVYLLFNIVPTLVELGLVATILLSRYSAWFMIATVITVSIYVALTFVITEWRMPLRARMNAMDSRANAQAIDSLLNYETVKYFGNEAFELRRYNETLAHWQDAAVKSQTSMSVLNFTQGVVIAGGVTAIMILASQGVVNKTMTLGDLVLVNAFLLQLFVPLNFLGMVYSQLKHALADMDRLFKLLDEQPEVTDRQDATTLVVSEARVRFEHVSFAYDPERPILFDVDFEIPPGMKLAVVGPSGAGKSTLARLLFRFYDVSGGHILINGQDIRDVSQQSLRAAIGIVPQDTVLFNESIAYNIAYARPDASHDEVVRAAQLAHIHHFILKLPKGYETLVGERGLKLSGGEKQRVAIARTILKKPRILIFDEATSSLDSRSEQAILEALHEVAADHTTLVIAHRLSTIVDADQILVLEQGRIVERGTHDQLLAADGLYASLWELQQRERQEQEGAQPSVAAAG